MATTPPTTMPPNSARTSQEVVEVLAQSQVNNVRSSQEVLEVLAQSSVNNTRVSQIVLEVLRIAPPLLTTPAPTTAPPTIAPTTAPPTVPTTPTPPTAGPTAAPTAGPTTPAPTAAPTTTPPIVYNTIPDTAPPFTPTVELTTPIPEGQITTEQSGPVSPTTDCVVEVVTPYQVVGAAIEVPVITRTDVRCSQFAIELFVGRLVNDSTIPDYELPVIPTPEPIEFPLDSIGFIEDDV